MQGYSCILLLVKNFKEPNPSGLEIKYFMCRKVIIVDFYPTAVIERINSEEEKALLLSTTEIWFLPLHRGNQTVERMCIFQELEVWHCMRPGWQTKKIVEGKHPLQLVCRAACSGKMIRRMKMRILMDGGISRRSVLNY